MTVHALPATKNTQLRSVGHPWARRKLSMIATKATFVTVLLAFAGLSPMRIGAIAAIEVAGLLFIITIMEGRRRDTQPQKLQPERLAATFVFFLAGQGVVLALTGGLSSPLLALLIGPTVAATATFGRSRESFVVLGTLGLMCVTLALLPAGLHPAIAQPYFGILALGSMLFVSIMMGSAVMGLSDGLWSTGRRLHHVCEGVLEEQATRKKDLEGVGAKVAHELKNPLAAIKGLLQLEQPRVRDEKSRRRFEVMASEVNRMEGILRDYLAFSTPLDTLRAVSTDLRGIVENVAAVLEGRAVALDVELRIEGDEVHVPCDPTRMKEAVLNLASNALDATGRGGVVTLRVSRASGTARVTIADTGVGMNDVVMARLGTPFFTTRKEGTGLGVSLARTVVAQHGGTLSFDSELERGTTVRIDLPLLNTGGGHGHSLARG